MARRNVVEYVVKTTDKSSAKLKGIEARIGGVARAAASMAAVVGGGLGAREVVEMADTWRLMENRIKLVTSGTEELLVVQEKLVDVARETRSSFESTANLYARVARSSRELGLSQQELLDFTTTVQQSIIVSGSTAAEASAGVIQFGQALASSRLSGDELRSVLEQMPRLAQAIAEGMDVGIGQLREMGEAGELTADKVLDSLRKAAPEIAAEFKQLAPLVSQAFVVMKSSMMSFIGALDRQSGVSAEAARVILEFADDLRLLGDALTGTIAPGENVSTTMQRIAIFTLVAFQAINQLIHGIAASFDFLGKFAVSTGEFIGAVSAQIANGTKEGVDEIATAFNETLDEIWSEDALADRREQMRQDMADMFETIARVMGDIPGVPLKPFDLDFSTGALDPVTRKMREEAARLDKTFSKLADSIILQSNAYTIAAESGEEYAVVLQRLKIEQMGFDLQNMDRAMVLIGIANQLNTQVAEAAARTTMEGMLEGLSNQNVALGIAANSSMDYAQALEEVEVKALLAASGNKELADDILMVSAMVRKRMAQAEDVDLVSGLLEELGLIKLTNRERAIQIELLQLSAHATEEQMRIVRETAGELFDRQQELQNQTKFMENIAEQAAKNIQQAFADFLFDPFEDGVKGMLDGFIVALRRMLAEMIAFQVLSSIPLFGDFFGGGHGESAAAVTAEASNRPPPGFLSRASGGPFTAGQPLLVGERGPELIIAGSSGSVVNNSATKALNRSPMQFVTNIDARGADPGLIARLPEIMEARDKQLLLAVKRFSETGVMPI